MTIGKLLDEFFEFIKGLPIKEYFDKAFNILKDMPKTMKNSSLKLFPQTNGDGYLWLYFGLLWQWLSGSLWKKW